MTWPKVEVIKDGRVVVLDGFTIVFFLNESHHLLASKIERALRSYLRLVGKDSVRYYIDDEGYTAPLTDDALEDLIADRLAASEESADVGVTLLGSDTGVSGYEFHYFGAEMPVEGWPGFRNYMYLWFPSALVYRIGFDSMRRFASDLAQFLPVSFGYASPALLYHHEIGEATRRVRRYPGFDVLLVRSVAMELDAKAAGVYWLSFLGPELTMACGGLESIREKLPAPAVVETVSRDIVAIALGHEPEVGDVNRKIKLPLYRALGSLLEAVLFFPRRNYFADESNQPDPEAMDSWHRRFLSDV